MKYIIQLDNVRAQNEMVRNVEPSDISNSSQPRSRHTLEQSTDFWNEEKKHIFAHFSEYFDTVKHAIENVEDSDSLSSYSY